MIEENKFMMDIVATLLHAHWMVPTSLSNTKKRRILVAVVIVEFKSCIIKFNRIHSYEVLDQQMALLSEIKTKYVC